MDWIKEYILSKNGASEGFPFGPDPSVFKVKEKMFALISYTKEPLSMNLKCEPEMAQILRSQFESIKPGYHMNKKHWNTIELDGSVHEDLVKKMIDESYDLVFKGLKKADREALLKE